jgi:predicted O-methyltransferase YrrM
VAWFRFPTDVKGWLSRSEGEFLADLAWGKLVLEIGSYHGRSTISMAQTAKLVHAIDTFQGNCVGLPLEYTYEPFVENLKRYGVRRWVVPHVGLDRHILPILAPVFDMIFIDGDHAFESVIYNLDAAEKLLTPTGNIVLHDYRQPIVPAVTAAIHVWTKDRPWQRDRLVDTTLALRRIES